MVTYFFPLSTGEVSSNTKMSLFVDLGMIVNQSEWMIGAGDSSVFVSLQV